MYVVQKLHFDNRKNKNTDLPSIEEAIELGWDNSVAADLHQYTAEDGKPNIKYVSPDGKREAIYNSNGQLVTDSRDIGTYNFCPYGGFWDNVGHIIVDVVPWVIFGNDDDDPGLIRNEFESLFD